MLVVRERGEHTRRGHEESKEESKEESMVVLPTVRMVLPASV